MKIVIDIDDIIYKEAVDSKVLFDEYVSEVAMAIINGIPLPEQHGRLIDADELLDTNIDTFSQQTELKIKFAPTIIEADRGE